MSRIKTELLQEGMVVTADVKNIDQMLLIPSGCTLTARHISILEAWGVSEIDVEAAQEVEDSSNPLTRLPADTVAKLTAEIQALFRQLDESNPVAMEVFKLILLRRARKYLTK